MAVMWKCPKCQYLQPKSDTPAVNAGVEQFVLCRNCWEKLNPTEWAAGNYDDNTPRQRGWRKALTNIWALVPTFLLGGVLSLVLRIFLPKQLATIIGLSAAFLLYVLYVYHDIKDDTDV